MIATIQEKVIERLESLAKRFQFEVIQKAQWANTGSLYLQAEGTFRTELTIAYDFQDTFATMYTDPVPSVHDGARPTASWPAGWALTPVTEWVAFRIDYRDESTFKVFFDYVEWILEEATAE